MHKGCVYITQRQPDPPFITEINLSKSSLANKNKQDCQACDLARAHAATQVPMLPAPLPQCFSTQLTLGVAVSFLRLSMPV